MRRWCATNCARAGPSAIKISRSPRPCCGCRAHRASMARPPCWKIRGAACACLPSSRVRPRPRRASRPRRRPAAPRRWRWAEPLQIRSVLLRVLLQLLNLLRDGMFGAELDGLRTKLLQLLEVLLGELLELVVAGLLLVDLQGLLGLAE